MIVKGISAEKRAYAYQLNFTSLMCRIAGRVLLVGFHLSG
jgi:hypothetical protein